MTKRPATTGDPAGKAENSSAGPLRPFPWDEAIGFGLGVLRLDPGAFWRMTPRELAHAIRAVRGQGAPLARADLARLIARFPDRSASGRVHAPVEDAHMPVRAGDALKLKRSPAR